MDVEEALLTLIAETDGPLADLEMEKQAIDRRISQLEAERYGLRLSLARHRGDPPPDPPDASMPEAAVEFEADPGWVDLGRTDAVVRVLLEAGRPLHRRAILAALASHGRPDNMADTSAALSYLKNANRVLSLGKGIWALPDGAAPDA